jgi:hypothetical protein
VRLTRAPAAIFLRFGKSRGCFKMAIFGTSFGAVGD